MRGHGHGRMVCSRPETAEQARSVVILLALHMPRLKLTAVSRLGDYIRHVTPYLFCLPSLQSKRQYLLMHVVS